MKIPKIVNSLAGLQLQTHSNRHFSVRVRFIYDLARTVADTALRNGKQFA